jgi:glucokinase
MIQRFLGLDLGGTNIKATVVEAGAAEPRVVTTSVAPTNATGGPLVVIDGIVALGHRVIEEYGPVEAVGLGVPGLFEHDSGRVVLFPNLPGPWPGHPLRDPVASGIGQDVSIVNDARAFTLAEGFMGAGRGCHTLVCVTLGTGVGGGVMIGGKLQMGAWGRAGEIGHQTVLPDGPLCGCGNRGCAEALTKADVLARLARRNTAEEVYSGARDGDEECLAAIRTVAGYLGIAIANAVTLLGPDRVVLGGGIVAAGDGVLDPIRAAVRERVFLVPTDEIEVVLAALGSHAGAIGAALAAFQGI